MVDTGASGNEMRLTYSAYTPPPPKTKKKFTRTRFRGRDRSQAKPGGTSRQGADSGSHGDAAGKQQRPGGPRKPGKREKIRFGQAPRESLPSSQVAAAEAPRGCPRRPAQVSPLRKPVT